MADRLTELRRALVRAGWRVERGRGGHWKCYSPDGRSIVVLPTSPSDHRAWRNTLAQLRRAGFDWPKGGKR